MNVARILAGGLGTRMQCAQHGDTPKQYTLLGGKPIVLWSILAFDACPAIDRLCIVAAANWHARIGTWLQQAGVRTPYQFALPGAERFDSAYHAICALRTVCGPEDIVLFHDAARPLVSQRIIAENIALAKAHGAVYTALPSQDTIIEGRTQAEQNDICLAHIPPRHTVYQGQTPQSFRYGLIAQAHAQFRTQPSDGPVTDDCTLVHRMGHPVVLCMGEKRNLKITTPEDYLFAQALVAAQPPTN